MELLLVRHGHSRGNQDRTLHQTVADHAIPLTNEGIQQANEAALKVQRFLQERDPSTHDWCVGHNPVRLWMSPYLRTRQTAEPFKSIVWGDGCPILKDAREDIALVEQQFGLFDGLSDEELQEKFPNEFAHYKKCEDNGGRFWARMPLGESRFDVTLRIHQIFGTWQRDLEKHGIKTLIIVSHGVTIRAIMMRWLHHSFEWFEQERNPPNCSIRLISGGKDLGFL